MLQNILLHGDPNPPIPPTILRAGPLTARFERGMLRDIRVHGVLALHQIYAALRDHNWATIGATLHDLRIDQQADSFHVTFRSEHRQADIDFVWLGDIAGSASGELTFRFRGEARSSFRRNRIGFCVLHPMQAAGASCRVEHTDGRQSEGVLPVEVTPYQPYLDIRALYHEAAAGLWIETRMTGDSFEMEDQRQWGDASYKTYCTPVGLPFPVEVQAGTIIEQTVTVKAHGTPIASAQTGGDGVTVSVLDGAAANLPALGLSLASHDETLSEVAVERLRGLALSHLRADVRLHQAGWQARAVRALNEAAALGCALEWALHVSDDARQELTAFAALLSAHPPARAARVLVFHAGSAVTAPQWVALARELVALDAPFGGGTDAFFTALNRNRPAQPEAFDVLAFSANPQVHAFDNDTLFEIAPVLPAILATARGFAGDARLAVSPLTLKMRWNPDATGAPVPVPAGELPPTVDVRQMSLLAAAWTVACVAGAARGGAESLTLFETTGWLGVMERAGGSPLPDKFPSVAGGMFPVYAVLWLISGFGAHETLPCAVSAPERVAALALRHPDGRMRLVLANQSAEPIEVRLNGGPLTGALACVVMGVDEAAALARTRGALPLKPVALDSAAVLTLPAYGIASVTSG